MKTKRHLYIFWSVLSLGLLSCAVNTYESQLTRRRRVFKLGSPNSKPSRQSGTGGRNPSQGFAARASRRPHRPLARSGIAYLPDVSVTCSTSDLVLRVKPSFYGMGAGADELTLGSACKSNGVLRPYGDLIFAYPLTACGAVRETARGYLLYKSVLHYEPSPKRFPRVSRRMNVDIECRYQRNHHVFQRAVRPTWETAVVRKRLKGRANDFQMELMDDSWSRPAQSRVYQLGKTVNIQVSAPHLPTGGKLYINTCYATPSRDSEYSIIGNLGCMLDSKSNPGASQFISRTDKTLRFSLKAFQFTADPDTQVNILCKLFVTSEDPGPAQKSCTYSRNRWKALTGDDSVCECCDSQCVTSKPRRALMEGSASSGSLLVSHQPYTAEDSLLPVSREGEATVNHYINEPHSHENLWESVDVVEEEDEEEEQDYEEEDDDEEQDYEGEEDDEEEQDYEEEEQLEEESGSVLEVRAKTDLDELGFRERVLMEKKESQVKDSNQSEEVGSGYGVQEGSEEEEIHLNQKEAEVLRHWEQLEQIFPSEVGLQGVLHPLVSEGEEDDRKHVGGGTEDEGALTSEVEWKNDDLAHPLDDNEMTWYFSWR